MAAGVLNHGQGNALAVKLDAAVRALNRGNGQAACNELGAFTNQIEAFINAGLLSAGQGQALTGPISNLCP
jgi:hypothetical protein